MTPPERDPYTGRMTTGHDWNGIKELATPIPKLVWFFLTLAVAVAILLWVLFPTWPYGHDYTRGILGVDQRDSVSEALEKTAAIRAPWEEDVLSSDFADLQQNSAIMTLVGTHGARLYSDNCSVCHGVNAKGGDGYPSLTDTAWLWGGDASTIMETLRVGINSQHEESRNSQMMAFGDTGMLSAMEVRDVASYVQSLSKQISAPDLKNSNEALTRGQMVFGNHCASCHGTDGRGMQSVGAPDLTDNYWIYGGDNQSIVQTIRRGRMGTMPHWESRLSEADRKILTLFILNKTSEAH